MDREEIEFSIGDPELDKGVLLPLLPRYRITVWLLRVMGCDKENHPHLAEMEEKLRGRIAYYDGPGNRKGATFSVEHRERLTKAKVGRKRKPFTEETKARMKAAKAGANNPMFGRKASEATREKLRQLSLDREAKKRSLGSLG
jgi:NUMOD3 motif